MSKLSIYETRWLNLVFEGKNKTYGAYQLRRESSRTTAVAFLFGLLFVGGISGGGLLLSSFGKAPVIETIPEETIVVVSTDPTVIPKPKLPETAAAAPITKVDKREDLVNPVITTPENADDVKRNDNPPTVTEPTPAGTETTPTPDSGSGTPTGANTGKPAVIPDNGTTIATTVTVDVMPEFPGGIKKFLEYVGRNFEKPEIDETVTVLMSFVIEKDGSMTDIKVLRNPGYGLDKEAIRVLKSQKTKWKPGVKNGQPIRVLYTLPIKVTKI